MSQLSQRQFQRWIRQMFAPQPQSTRRATPAGGRPMALESLDERINPAPYTFPSDNTLFFQTSGRERPPTIGDWYTTATSASADRVHRISIEITAAQLAAAGGSVTVTVNDGESTNGAGPNDESFDNGDPTRFRLLGTDGKTVLDSKVFAADSPNGQSYTFTAITKAGVYTLTSEDGAFPISGDATAALNNDDNAFSVTVSDDGGGNRGLIGFTQATFQQTAQTTRSFNFLVGNATPGLFLRNFDLDSGVSSVFYTDPTGKTYAGTASGNGVWNGGGDLNTGGDTINGPITPGFWTVTFADYTAGNQSLFEANTTDGTRLTVFDTAILTGNVYIDANNDGLRGAAEAGIGGAVVTLTGTDAAGNPVNVATTTAADGTYRFVGLAPSDATGYTITETQPAGFFDGKDAVGSRGGNLANDKLSGILLGQGQAGDGYNFGEIAPSSLSGSVFVDANNDGARQGAEAGIAKAVVVLSGTDTNGANVNLTATTDAAGNYSFTGLAASNAAGYTVTEAQPAGFLDGKDAAGSAGGTLANDKVSAVVLGAGVAATGYTFGELAPASLAGSVFIDANNDGTRQGAETGIPNALVTLTGTNDLGAAVSLTATTDASGNYSFANLRPSTAAGYTLTETQPAGFLDGKDAAGTLGGTLANDKVSAVVVASGSAGVGYTFGELAPASLAGRVYFDRDATGTQTTGDLGISKAIVVLTGADDLGNPVSLTATTAADGSYGFTNLRPSGAAGYTLAETQPAGYLDGADNLGTLGGTPSNDKFAAIAVTSGAVGNNYAFGELGPSITGRVFVDFNRDGTVNGADAGRQTVTVALIDGAGATVATTTTAADGTFSFGNVLPGTYTVTVTPPAGFGTSTPVSRAADASTGTSPVAVTPFGLTLSTISGTVYRDDNTNGALDGTDTKLSGVVVTLRDAAGNPVVDALGNAVAAVTTGAAGTYTFANLVGGVSYRVIETQPAGLVTATNTVGTFNGAATGSVAGDTFTVPFPNGQDGVGYNFGEVPAATASVSGFVYRDRSNEGLRAAAGEPGIQGVVVVLSGTDGTGNAVSRTATTDATGAYSFTGLAASNASGYTITETQPAGFFDGLDTRGNVSAIAGSNATDVITGVVLATGGTAAENDFGELEPASLAGSVFRDDDNSGAQNGAEPGIAGVVLTLSGTNDLGAAVSQTATTGAGGAYSFANLRPGTYTITETQPAQFSDGKDAVGTAGGTLGNDVLSAIPLGANVAGTGYTFGELGTQLSGRVFVDLNRDGAQNGADSGRQNVVVTLSDGTTTLTATTDASGNFSFANLPAGSYTLTELVPAGFGTSAGATTRTVTVPLGGSAGNTFGLTVSTLAGTVYRDDNNSGTFNAGDLALSGVVVSLFDAAGKAAVDAFGNAVAPATTGAAGTYTFANLLGGVSYRVVETQPAGLNSATNTVGTFGGTVAGDTFTVPAGTGADGTGYNFGEVLPGATVSGFVYRDNSNDGLRAASGEAGVQGAVVVLSGVDDLGATVSRTATTDANGFYSFAGLRPSGAGGYTVTETQPAGFFDGLDTRGNAAAIAGSNTTDAITGIAVVAGATASENDFGELTPASLSGLVFFDRDASGTNTAGDPAINGAKVVLSGTDDLGNAVNVTAFTAGGAYSFTNLRPGTYSLAETQPAGYLDGAETLGSAGGTPGNDIFTGVTLAPGTAGGGYAFGELGPNITGSVFIDNNRDGAVNGADPGKAGVAVNLLDSNGNVVATTTTGPGGTFAFANQLPGTYTVSVVPTPGFGTSTPTTQSVDATQGVNPPAAAPVGLTLSTVAGRVYLDVNNNGVFDSGTDSPIGGVQVRLLDAAGNPAVDGFGNVVAAFSTGLDGTYSFAGVVGGNYQVVETQPANFGQGTNTVGSFGGAPVGTVSGDTFAVPVPNGQDGTGYNFGEVGGGVSGSVYLDANNDGLRGPAELGVSGVTIQLVNAAGTVVGTTVTGADGSYSFSNLLPGTYTVVEVAQPTGLLDGRETRGNVAPIPGSVGTDVIAGVAVAPGVGSPNNNFGELAPASVGDVVFTDANGNGVQDTGETGVTGVTVTLTGTDDLGAVSQTATTTAGGAFNFGNLRPGSYTLTFTAPSGQRFTYQNRGGDPAKDSDADPATGATASFALVAGQSDATRDAGVFTPVSIGQLVWLNNDGNATQDPGEPGLPNVVVELTQFGPDGVLGGGDDTVTTATTNPQGLYNFANLAPGNFRVRVISGLPGGTSPNFDADGGNDSSTLVTLASGQASTTTNFGYAAAGTLGGVVWLDLNADGVQQPGEPGLPNVSVRIREAGADGVLGNADDVLSGPSVTGATGSYSFTGLPGGLYRVDVNPATLPPGADPTFDYDGPPFSTAVVVFPGTSAITNVNFGYRGTGSIGDTVFNDRNGNGAQDANEPGLPGAVVTLVEAGADGKLGTADDRLFAPQTVGSDGRYLFSNLLPGSYRVAVDAAPASPGLAVTADPQGPLDGVADVTLTATSLTNLAADFGYRGPGVVGDRLWFDANADGIQDPGEPGIVGATVTLINVGADGKLGTADDLSEGTVTTGADGIYTFAGLPVGTYAVQVTGGLPVGLTAPTFDADGIATPNAATVSVTQAVPVVTTADFGYKGAGSIGDRVFADTNGNGAQDPNEPGIVGATVTLTWAGQDGDFATTADNATLTATTGANGVYGFGNLPAGNFRVAVNPATVGAGLSPSFDADGVATPNVAATSLTAGQVRTDLDFGYANLGAVTGVVFVDSNNNGTRDPGEPGLPGVTVTLTGTDTSGNPVTRVVTTNPDGSYSFPSLPPGSYTLTETQPTGFGSSTPNAVPVTVPAGGSAVVNYGETTSSFAGTVYIDRDLSGNFTPADAPLAGVVVALSGTDVNGAPVTRTATTGADGRYTFTGLLAGTYTVTETQPSGVFPGVGTVGSLGGTLANPLANSITSVNVGPATSGTGYNFGEFAPSSVAGAVYTDANNNGVRNPGELGIGGVAITISGTAFAGTPAARPLVASDLPGNSLTVLTDAAGNFLFAGIPPGVYAITEAQPAAFFDGLEQNADPNGPNTVAVGNDVFGNVVTAPTGVRGAFNFGEVPPSGVSGTVYVDSNVNGRQDPGEPSVPGVLVTLTGTDDRGGLVTRTVTTAPDGSYSVTGLRPGSYSVRFAPPDGSLVFGPEALNGVAVTPGSPVGNLNFAVRPVVRSVPLNPAVQTPMPVETTVGGIDPGTKRQFLGSSVVGGTTVVPADFSGLPRSPQFINAANRVGRTDGLTTPIAVATGADSGSEPRVRVFDFATGKEVANFLAYESTFTGGVRVATADLDGDGIDEVITAPGIGGGPIVKVFDLQGNLLRQFLVYEESYRGGLWVAAGDLDGDGRAEIVTGADIGGGPRVRVLDGLTGAGKADFFAYDSTFRGGVRVAVGDLDGDGRAEIVTGAGVGGGPDVRVFDGAGTALRSFQAFEDSFRGGVAVAIGDLDGSGRAQIITTAGLGGGPRVLTTDGQTLQPVQTFFAFDPEFRGGLRIATADINADGRADLVLGGGAGSGGHVVIRDAQTGTILDDFYAADPALRGGINVG